jgi:hypothetical protein
MYVWVGIVEALVYFGSKQRYHQGDYIYLYRQLSFDSLMGSPNAFTPNLIQPRRRKDSFYHSSISSYMTTMTLSKLLTVVE